MHLCKASTSPFLKGTSNCKIDVFCFCSAFVFSTYNQALSYAFVTPYIEVYLLVLLCDLLLIFLLFRI